MKSIWKKMAPVSFVFALWFCTVDGHYDAGPFSTYRDCALYQSGVLSEGHSARCHPDLRLRYNFAPFGI